MDEFLKKYNKILSMDKSWISFEYSKRSSAAMFRLSDDLICEMQNDYSIPKNLLTHFVGEVFRNGFSFVEELSFKKIVKLIEQSDNFADIKFDFDNVKKCEDQKLLFIAIPYDLNVWKKELKSFIDSNSISSLFKNFDNQCGASGDYTDGYFIIVNSACLDDLKDIEEVVEHELVHIFKAIDKTDSSVSLLMKYILNGKSNEFETYVINAMNRLEKLYNKYVVENSLEDSNDCRFEFLEEVFNDIDTLSEDRLIEKYKKYDSSKLLENTLMFLKEVVERKPVELKKMMKKIYDHFDWF